MTERRDVAAVVAYVAALVGLVAGAMLLALSLSDLIFWEHQGLVGVLAWVLGISAATLFGAWSYHVNQRERGAP